jgi:hypothetical protein
VLYLENTLKRVEFFIQLELIIEKIQFTNVQAGKSVDIEFAVCNVDFDSSIIHTTKQVDKLKRKVHICICFKILNLQHPDRSKLQCKYSLSPSVLQFRPILTRDLGKVDLLQVLTNN